MNADPEYACEVKQSGKVGPGNACLNSRHGAASQVRASEIRLREAGRNAKSTKPFPDPSQFSGRRARRIPPPNSRHDESTVYARGLTRRPMLLQ